MLGCGHGEADGLHSPRQRIKIGEYPRAECVGHTPGPFRIPVHDANQLRPFEPTIDARVVTPEIANADHGYTNGSLVHPAFAPSVSFGEAFGALGRPLGCVSGAKACMAIPASSAASISRGRAKSRERQASTASATAR